MPIATSLTVLSTKGRIMEINSGHSNVQIAIAVQPQNKPAQRQTAEYGNDDNAVTSVIRTVPAPSINTRGEEVGNLINTWA
jgi:hypothetical protein